LPAKPCATGFQLKQRWTRYRSRVFTKINLLPVLAARLQPGMPDIRITDAEGKQVPYILKSDVPAFSENRFKALPILSNKKEADKQTQCSY